MKILIFSLLILFSLNMAIALPSAKVNTYIVDSSKPSFTCEIAITNNGTSADTFYIIYWLATSENCNLNESCSRNSWGKTVYLTPSETIVIPIVIWDDIAPVGDSRWCISWARPIHGYSSSQSSKWFRVTEFKDGEAEIFDINTTDKPENIIPYDIDIDVDGFIHTPTNEIKAQIYFYNSLFENDINVSVDVYLLSPKNEIISPKTFIINKIPICQKVDNLCVEPSILWNVSLTLPPEQNQGEWQFVVKRNIIKRSDNFYVITKFNIILVIVIILILLNYYLNIRRNK